jgi:hypothetical protein
MVIAPVVTAYLLELLFSRRLLLAAACLPHPAAAATAPQLILLLRIPHACTPVPAARPPLASATCPHTCCACQCTDQCVRGMRRWWVTVRGPAQPLAPLRCRRVAVFTWQCSQCSALCAAASSLTMSARRARAKMEGGGGGVAPEVALAPSADSACQYPHGGAAYAARCLRGRAPTQSASTSSRQASTSDVSNLREGAVSSYLRCQERVVWSSDMIAGAGGQACLASVVRRQGRGQRWRWLNRRRISSRQRQRREREVKNFGGNRQERAAPIRRSRHTRSGACLPLLPRPCLILSALSHNSPPHMSNNKTRD